MPKFTMKPTGEWSLGVSLEEIAEWLGLLRKTETPYLIYDNAFASYTCDTLSWLSVTTAKGRMIAPYTIEHDYRSLGDSGEWGTVVISEDFRFPVQLNNHKEQMVKRFDGEERLKKGDRACPRVRSIQKGHSDRLVFTIERAFYFDQVGTNLTLDFPLSPELQVLKDSCATVRAWDVRQASVVDQPPPFLTSRLANTIGVAVGVTAKDRHGQPQVLKRKRSQEVAVYEGLWHVPFSFALAWKEDLKPGNKLNLSDLISQDWGHELAQELGLEVSDFEPPRPLAFCRDLVRGGKPQFFFELASRKSFEDLRRFVGTDRSDEYVGKIKATGANTERHSPELLAFSLLTLASSV